MEAAVVFAVILVSSGLALGQSPTGATLPVAYSAKIMNGSGPTCPPREQRDGVRAEIRGEIRTLLQDSVIPQLALDAMCENATCFGPPCRCGFAGRWRQLAFLNISDPNQECPPQWRQVTSPARSCGRKTLITGGVCDSVIFNNSEIEYSRVCGRIIGESSGRPDGFSVDGRGGSDSIDGIYLDGVSMTYGSPRKHIWSFAGTQGVHHCPCFNSNSNAHVPQFVEQNYFCENIGEDIGNKLWDGEGCSESLACECSFNNPPWFCRRLDEATTDDIEVRICGNARYTTEDVLIEFMEIYVQ